MNPLIAILTLTIIIALALPIAAAFTSFRHPLVGLLTVIPTLLGGLGAWHAYAESGSLPWTIGYALLAVISAVASLRHFSGSSAGQRSTSLAG